MQLYYETRQALIESAIRVVARVGLDKTTTKAISIDSGLNEAYIYRAFENKEDLLRSALHLEDVRFVNLVLKTLPVMNDESLPWRERCFRLWQPAWDFILEFADDFVFYIRYYYSANFQKYELEEHNECFSKLISAMSSVFQPGTPVGIILHQVFETMLSYGARVINGELPNNADSSRLAFEQVYCCILPSIREELLHQ